MVLDGDGFYLYDIDIIHSDGPLKESAMEAIQENCGNHHDASEASEDGRQVSEQEYWDHYYIHPFHCYEWNNGRLEERPMTDPASYAMYAWFCELLNHFLTIHPVGMTMGLDFGFRLAIPGKTAVRKPDLALILKTNPVQLHRFEPSYKGVFDLCVESLSHTSKKAIQRDTVVKKEEYAVIGVDEYYILDSMGAETAFYRRGPQGDYEQIEPENDVIHSGVLPGFRFRVSDLYSRPPAFDMADDNVYTEFVLPYYTQEKQKAEEERRRAENERRKSERMAEKLRSMGLSDEEIRNLFKNGAS